MTKRHRGSAESIEFAQPKQSKVPPSAHDRESSRDRSAVVAPVISVQPHVTRSVPDRASCDEDGINMETSDDIITAVLCGPAVSKSGVKPDLRPPRTGRSDDGSHHSPASRKAAVQRSGTSQLPVSSRRLIIYSPALGLVWFSPLFIGVAAFLEWHLGAATAKVICASFETRRARARQRRKASRHCGSP
ncbi:hypothetical protein E2C01_102212 [Portunus trituberculatus]|uniref:Uncharacterized protein n=1 Tax=Portunus trituberculatus TaxID=210409 RepID=A0A5B7KHY5_PORTR|nr:hypothetical protein [Portunus trituberculatus]